MNLTDQINTDIKTAMKARDKDKLEALRAIKSALLLEATKGGDSSVSDEAGLKILQKLQKQRMDAYQIYVEQNRA
ncbi:MAG: GatB/YqeY domain-containing protein, partial [Bacteroidetes bacterium]